jgi:maltokinase
VSEPADDPPPGASAALVRELAPCLMTEGAERPITVDQTNRSVVVDDAVIVKWFRPPRPLPHHGSTALAHLAEVGFDAMPQFVGSHVVGVDVVASVSAYLPGALDGWDWYLDELHAWVDGTLDLTVLERRATDLGSLTGRLHVALATPSSVRPHPIGSVAVHVPFDRMGALLRDARAITTGETAEHLASRWERIEAAVRLPSGLDPDEPTPAIDGHGDLHVGNVLDVAGRLLVIDFDGNPLLAAPEPQPAAADLASLLQSIDHIGRIVDHRTGGTRRADVARFIDESTGRALAAYRAELTAARLSHLLDDRLLTPMRIAQELHELAYAAAHLPHWVYVPDAALTTLFPDD